MTIVINIGLSILISILLTILLITGYQKFCEIFFHKEIKVKKKITVIILIICFLLSFIPQIDKKATLKDLVGKDLHTKRKDPEVTISLVPRDVSLYKQGNTFNGILWDNRYEKYELALINNSDYSLYDFKCKLLLPGTIIRKELMPSMTDNFYKVTMDYNDYEIEIFEKSQNGDFVKLSFTADNKIYFALDKFEQKHRIGIWFYVKRIKIDGCASIEFFTDEKKEIKREEKYKFYGKDHSKLINISDSISKTCRAPELTMNMQTTHLDKKDSSVTVSTPKY